METHAEDAVDAAHDPTVDTGPGPEGGASADARGRGPGGAGADGGDGRDRGEPGQRPRPERSVGRVLEAHRPRRVAPGEADRRAAVVLVLRPGGTGERPVGQGGPSGADGREGPADGRRVVAAAPGSPPPLFPRPLPPDLADLEALFILRAEREGDPWSGHVGLPGGHEEPGDADLPEAALRELREETGLALPRAGLLGRLDDVHPRSRRLPSVAVSPFVAWHGADASVTAGPEVAGHFWTPLAELESPARRALLAFRREGAYRVFPGVEQGGALIWGLTFVILRRFLSLLPREGAWPTR